MSSQVRIGDACRVSHNLAEENGAGVAVMNTALLLLTDGTNVSHNKAGGKGAGIFAYKNASVTVSNHSVLEDNAASQGGAVAIMFDCRLYLLDGAVVKHNVATIYGARKDTQEVAA
eukprot:gene25342-30935_t